jgi:hypothetical protein
MEPGLTRTRYCWACKGEISPEEKFYEPAAVRDYRTWHNHSDCVDAETIEAYHLQLVKTGKK